MALLKQSTARSRAIFMVDASDHVSGKTGLTLTITASKDGGSFASITPTVTELANGWYKLALTTGHTDTLGDFALHITGTGADPTDLVDEVVLDLPGASVASLGTQAKADVNAEVVDCLNTDTYGEPGQETPPATTTLVKKIGYSYKLARNKKLQTGDQFSLFASNGTTVDQKATISGDTSQTEFGALVTGP